MSIAQQPVPYTEFAAEQQARIRAEQERDQWRNRFMQEQQAHTQTKRQLAQERQRQQQQSKLWKTKLKPAEKATLVEFQRQLESPQAHRDEQGFTRMCFKTAAINIGMSDKAPKNNFEKVLEQCPDLPTLAGAQVKTREEYDEELRRNIPRLYIRTEKSLVTAAIASTISKRIVQGGNQYICNRCGSKDVVIYRRLHCNHCGHETDLEPTHPNGKLKSSTGISGKTNLSLPPQMGYSPDRAEIDTQDEPPAENFLSDTSQLVGVVIKPLTPPENDSLAAEVSVEYEAESDPARVIEEAARLLLAIAGDDGNHIEMSRTGPKKYYDASPPRPLELADLIDHLRAGQARGSRCCYRDGRTRGQCFDKDEAQAWEQMQAAARTLAQAGYSPILEESPADRGGHLWILYDDLVDVAAARVAVLEIAPELADCIEYWPGPADARAWNRVRLPGGFYCRYGRHVEQPIKAWCRLANVATGEIASDGRSAAKLLLASLTPAAIVPALSVIDTQGDPEDPPVSAERAGALLNTNESSAIVSTGTASLPYRLPEVDAAWIAKHGPVEATTLWFAITDAYSSAWFNEHHALEDIRPLERNKMALSPNGEERTASTSYRDTVDGERWADFSAHGRRLDGTHEGGDALELAVKVWGMSKSEILRGSTREIQAQARADLESAAAAGQSVPAWLEEPCIITPAGRRQHERLLTQGEARGQTVMIDEQQPEQLAPAAVFTIYVDEIQTYDTPLPYKRWCHMAIAGSIEHLHAFAAQLGLKAEWFQDKHLHPHYDLTPAKRAQAIKLGAVPVSTLELLRQCHPAMPAPASQLEQLAPAVAIQDDTLVVQCPGQGDQLEQKPPLVKDQRVNTPAGIGTISVVRYFGEGLCCWRCSVWLDVMPANGSRYAIFDAAEVELLEQGRLL